MRTAPDLTFDVVIIGAGVVGLAVAQQLTRRDRKLAILEKHDGFGKETSSRNSEVIHAGIYYPRDFLKNRLCVEGNRLLYAWCGKHNVPIRPSASSSSPPQQKRQGHWKPSNPRQHKTAFPDWSYWGKSSFSLWNRRFPHRPPCSLRPPASLIPIASCSRCSSRPRTRGR